jgi:hypothetical protein
MFLGKKKETHKPKDERSSPCSAVLNNTALKSLTEEENLAFK